MSIAEICNKMYGKTIRECSNEQVYTALLALVKKVTEERKEAQERQEKENGSVLHFRRISDWKAAVKQPD